MRKMRKLPNLSKPIAEMNRMQLVRLTAWLIGERYFSTSLGKGNSLNVTLGWVSDDSVDVDEVWVVVGNGKTLDMQPLQDLIRGYHQRIKDVCERMDELAKQEGTRQSDFGESVISDAELLLGKREDECDRLEGQEYENRSH